MWLEHDLNGYATLLTILSIVAIPLLLLEYFYTKERVIEDVQEQGNTNNIPVKEQLKALLTNKYFVIFTILMTVGGIVDNFKGGNVQYFYIKYLLGGENNWAMFTIYQVVTGVPLGIGAFVIYPLAKKFGIKNVSLVGYGLVLIGSIVGWLQPSNMIVAFVAGVFFPKGLRYVRILLPQWQPLFVKWVTFQTCTSPQPCCATRMTPWSKNPVCVWRACWVWLLLLQYRLQFMHLSQEVMRLPF